MKNLTNLRKIAEAATPGPWRAQEGYYVNTVPEFDLHRFDVMSEEVAECDLRQADATHIATFDPPTVLALLSRLEQAEQAVARVREALSSYPRTCDRHTEDDPVKCGWQRAVIDVQDALVGEQS